MTCPGSYCRQEGPADDDSNQEKKNFTIDTMTRSLERRSGLLVGLICMAPVTVAFQPLVRVQQPTFTKSRRRSSVLFTNQPQQHPPSFVVDNDYPNEDTPQFVPSNTKGMDVEAYFEFFVPLLAPFVAFLSYDLVASAFANFVELLSDKNWVAVDGGAYQAKIIAPAINGVVVPAIAVLFATLTSNTISNLRLRQVSVRLAINIEASELRVLECLVNSFPPGPIQDRCRSYLIHYATRIIAESQPGNDAETVNPRRGMDSELNRFSMELNQSYTEIPAHLANESYQAVSRLREQRQNRVTALQSTYPPLHFAILFALALGECIGFLMEANQDFLVFLSAVQLKILWSMLTFTFTACFTVFYDLRSPFGGSYQISASVDQLYPIRATLKEAVSLSLQQKQEAVSLSLQHHHLNKANTTTTSSNEDAVIVTHELN